MKKYLMFLVLFVAVIMFAPPNTQAQSCINNCHTAYLTCQSCYQSCNGQTACMQNCPNCFAQRGTCITNCSSTLPHEQQHMEDMNTLMTTVSTPVFKSETACEKPQTLGEITAPDWTTSIQRWFDSLFN